MMLLFVVLICVAVVYMISTSKLTDKERDEMLNDDEMFP